MHSIQLSLDNELATDQFGTELAVVLMDGLLQPKQKSLIIYLEGELGAGKTSVVRACLRALGIDGPIKSPTYTLLEPYETKGQGIVGLKIAHLDLYRLQEPEELDYIGGRDLPVLYQLVFVEWPSKGLGSLPDCDIKIQLNHEHRGRSVKIFSENSEFINKLKSIKNN